MDFVEFKNDKELENRVVPFDDKGSIRRIILDKKILLGKLEKGTHLTFKALRILSGITLKDEDFVFSQLDGKPLLPNTVTHNWIKLVRRTGLSGIRLHDARHSHASLMLKQGIHPKIVQERLGHASIQVTLDTYSHVVPGLQEAAAEGFDQIIHDRGGFLSKDTKTKLIA